MVQDLLQKGITLHTVRDITRGGLATVANELAEASQVKICLEEEKLPVKEAVQGLCGILGLEPINMGNEGKLLIALPAEEAEKALELIKADKYGAEAAIVGEVMEGKGVRLQTALGGSRRVLPLRGEGFPRIC